MFETFHQSPHGDFKPTFYNPFEIKHRRRTSKAQFRVLETAFQENDKPNASSRRALAAKLGMTPRAVQVWFQNRRAKNKNKVDGVDSESASPTLSVVDVTAGGHLINRSNSFAGQKPPSILHSNGLGRRHSMPEMQNPVMQLPFRELHEAIFGRAPIQSKMESYYPCPSNPVLPIRPMPRKNSGCSMNFLNSFVNLGLTNNMESYVMPALYDPMISGDQSRMFQSGQIPEMAAPSISAPESSPSMSHEDVLQLQNALRMGQPPNAAIVEAMANRLSDSLTPAELDMLLHGYPTGQQRKDGILFNDSNDLTGYIFPPTDQQSMNPMELLSCLPHADQFLFQNSYVDDNLNVQFS